MIKLENGVNVLDMHALLNEQITLGQAIDLLVDLNPEIKLTFRVYGFGVDPYCRDHEGKSYESLRIDTDHENSGTVGDFLNALRGAEGRTIGSGTGRWTVDVDMNTPLSLDYNDGLLSRVDLANLLVNHQPE